MAQGGGNQGNASGDGGGFFVVVILILALPLIAGAVRPYYNTIILGASGVMLLPVSVFSGEAAKVRAKIKSTKAKEAEPKFVSAAWRYVGRCYRWVLAPLMLLMAWHIMRKNVLEKYRRRLNMWQLVQNNAADFPCLAPIVKVGPITEQPYGSGSWAVARAPVQYLVENGILLDPDGRAYPPETVLSQDGLPRPDSPALGQANQIAVNKLTGLLIGQLGQRFDGDLGKLPDYQKGLALALIAHALDRKDVAFKALDQLSLSWDKDTHRVNVAGADELLIDLMGSLTPQYIPEVERHKTYVNVWFMALLKWARVKGALPSSLWIWLRPTDRILFYSLNQLGGRTAWTESAGPWSHFLAESAAGKTLETPEISRASNGIRECLIQEGWLGSGEDKKEDKPESQPSEVKSEQRPEEIKPTFDFSPGLISPDDFVPDIESEIDAFINQGKD